MNKKLILTALVAAIAAGGIALAAETVGRHGPMAADTDGNGNVSRAEFFRAAENRFKRLDANGDRRLTTGEYGRRMLRSDGDGDGVVTFVEATAAASARFKAQDANHDGQLTGAEVHRGPHGGSGMRRGGGLLGMMIERADADHDGRISRDEMRADADTRFARLDADRDGFIDRAELETMRGPSRGGRDGAPLPPGE